MSAGSSGGRAAIVAVTELLEDARSLGFLGPGPVAQHVEHARGFAVAAVVPCGSAAGPGPAAECSPPTSVVDLGAGGGLPGLVLAVLWPDSRFVLVEVAVRRAAFLRRAVDRCGWAERVEVVEERAEVVGRDPNRRERADVVVARSFGPPAVTAECAAPLLRAGGRLVVSEPPGVADARRWPVDGLAVLGLGASVSVRDGFGYRVTVQSSPCPARYPRRVGIPAKRPLF